MKNATIKENETVLMTSNGREYSPRWMGGGFALADRESGERYPAPASAGSGFLGFATEDDCAAYARRIARRWGYKVTVRSSLRFRSADL